MRRYTAAEKLKAVRLCLEEGFSQQQVCDEIGMAHSGLSRWIGLYRQQGEAGLQNRLSGRRAAKLPEAITRQIVGCGVDPRANLPGATARRSDDGIQILMSVGKLTPLGDPAANAPKWFAAVEMIQLATDQAWLHKATKEIAKYWQNKRERRGNCSAVK